ncbi:response regulator [Opitutus terrae]|uniref:Response regulator receiver protein n=1 Tax=Opitutus terrae (strain DSM 11246 / JCM 15787 / PB90-1) TaxID=452637 RepID=B1ZPM9_OPITP|nr:response regulator [Opitutus terrae]ACB74548.1 response regulator receiver protein [Opitutus terrae PB90-1]
MPLRILTVDDSRTVRIIIRNAFKRFDCEIIEAGNGLEGLEKAKSKPDLVLLDITMPTMDGLGMLEGLRANPELQDLPVIMLTAEGQKSTADQTVALGSRGYVVKPFTNEMLIQQVSKVVSLVEKQPVAS